MTKHLILLVIATLCATALYVVVGVSSANAAAGDIYNLGTLGEGEQAEGFSINDAGQVAGYSLTFGTTFSSMHAFRYDGIPGSGGAMLDLSTLGGPDGRSGATGINNSGQVVGGTTVLRPEDDPEGRGGVGYRYTGTPGAGGVMENLGYISPNAINDAGQITGSFDKTTSGYPHAMRYTGSPGAGEAIEDLGTLGGYQSYGWAINNAGQVAGLSTMMDEAVYHAFLYTGTPGAGGTMADLGTLGGTQSYGNAINNAGQVAGFAFLTGDIIDHAFLYTGTPGAGGTMVDLGTLGGASSSALGMNDAGFVVGSAERSVAGTYGATLWLNDAAHTAIDLDAWLRATNPTLSAYWTEIGSIYDINNHGLITGIGIYNDGPGGLSDGFRPFILDASSLVGVPEPASLALLALGVPLLVWRNLRQLRTGARRFALVAATRALALARSDQ